MEKLNFKLMKHFAIILLWISGWNLHSQASSWNQLCKLDSRMNHSSGILSLNQGLSFWTQVDNNSPEEIYEISTDCRVLRTLKMTNVSKTDWEDITTDYKGTIYIGDFGNNNNDRSNLKIYILKNVDQHSSDQITAERITFSYANQKDFPPSSAEQNFDMEAMVWYQDSLHLFSKNRTSPFTGYTYQYTMPAIPGDYKLSPVDSFKTGPGPMLFFWITGAAINPVEKQLILLSHDRIWMFTDFQSSRFFQGKSQMIVLPTFTQKEGICYAKDNTWYLTDEYNSTINLGGNLYEMKLDQATNSAEAEEFNFEIHPNPVQEFLQILFHDDGESHDVRIYNFMGKLCLNYTFNKLRNIIPMKDLSNGIYFIQTTSGKLKKLISKKIVVDK